MKIYTRTGDKGQTSVLGGKRVSKSDLRIEAYGNTDELNAYIGLLRDHKENTTRAGYLTEIQSQLFTIGSHLAVEPGKSFDYIPEINESFIESLEKAIDNMNDNLPEMKNFVLPGGHLLISWCHIARCVCRRVERSVIALSEKQKIDEIIIRYLNRLSDYLFVLSRKIANDLNVKEVPWKPRD